jgi:hypothetical protein
LMFHRRTCVRTVRSPADRRGQNVRA